MRYQSGMLYQSDVIDITCKIHAETRIAFLVSDTGEERDAVWLPKSQVEYGKNTRTGLAVVSMPEWLARDKGLI